MSGIVVCVSGITDVWVVGGFGGWVGGMMSGSVSISLSWWSGLVGAGSSSQVMSSSVAFCLTSLA